MNADDYLRDLYGFLTDVWGLELVEKPHREMVAVLQECEEDDDCPNGMLVVPRGTYKTSIACGTVVWRQLRHIHLRGNLYHRTALASATLALVRGSITVILGQLEHNARLKALYGELYQPAGYRQQGSKVLQGDGIVLKPRLEAGEIAAVREPNFWVASQRRIAVGMHADEGYWDDLMNDQMVKTPYQRENAKNYYRLLHPILNPKDRTGRPSRETMNATRWHDDDVPGMVMSMIEEKEKEDPGYKAKWRILQRGSHTEVGSEVGDLYFPSVLTEEVLKEKADTMGPYLFSCNYLNDPIAQRGFVDEDQIKFVRREKFPQLRQVCIVGDPNHHRKNTDPGCWASMLVRGFDRFGNLYFLDARGSREWDSDEYVDNLLDLSGQYDSPPVLLEDDAAAGLDSVIRYTENSTGQHLRVRWMPIKRDQTKEDRWQGMKPLFKRGQVFFAEEIDLKIKREIKSELVRGTASRFKDFLDAMALGEIGVKPKFDKQGQQQEVVKQEPDKPGFTPTLAGFFPEKKWRLQ